MQIKLFKVLSDQTKKLKKQYPHARTVEVPIGKLTYYFKIQDCKLYRLIPHYKFMWVGENIEMVMETLEMWDDIEKAMKKSHEKMVYRAQALLNRFAPEFDMEAGDDAYRSVKVKDE